MRQNAYSSRSTHCEDRRATLGVLRSAEIRSSAFSMCAVQLEYALPHPRGAYFSWTTHVELATLRPAYEIHTIPLYDLACGSTWAHTGLIVPLHHHRRATGRVDPPTPSVRRPSQCAVQLSYAFCPRILASIWRVTGAAKRSTFSSQVAITPRENAV